VNAAAIAPTLQPATLPAGQLFPNRLDDDPLLDSVAVLRLLRNRVPGLATRPITGCTVSPLKNRFRSRRVIAVDIAVAGPGADQTTTLHWIAKTHAGATDAAAEFRALSELMRAGFGHTGRVRVPRPICLVPDWRLFVEERASGSALRTFLGGSSGSPATAVRMAAQWLRKLHSLPLPVPANCEYEAENQALEVFTENLRCRQPSLAAYLDRQGTRLRDRMAGWRGVPCTRIHGDFHPENVYVSDDAVTVIDFDRFAIADPAKDLGSFITQVRAMSYFSGLPARSAEGNERAFLSEYVRGVPSHQAGPLLDRVAAYTAFFALEVAYYTLCVLRVSDPRFARKWLLYGTARYPGVGATQELTAE
jgi:Phosphotransferase enzyme family